MVNVFFWFLPPCLISLNNLDSSVYVKNHQWVCEMTFPTGSALMAPPTTTYPDAIYSGARIFNSSENHAFHPSDTSQRLSLWGDWWWQHVLLRSCFLLSKLCKRRKSPRAWIAIISAPIAAALSAYRRHLLWPRTLPRAKSDISQNTVPEWVYSYSAWALCFNRNADITKICLNYHENKVTKTNAISWQSEDNFTTFKKKKIKKM